MESAWYNDGTTWILETFIDWTAFDNGLAFVAAEDVIYLEARARDDDDIDSWESMFQWSTTNYDVENTGEGMGAVTLSSTEVEPASVRSALDGFGTLSLYPNPATSMAELHLKLDRPGDVSLRISDLTGKEVGTLLFQGQAAGAHTFPVNVGSLRQGVYFMHVRSGSEESVLKFIKK